MVPSQAMLSHVLYGRSVGLIGNLKSSLEENWIYIFCAFGATAWYACGVDKLICNTGINNVGN